MRRTALAAAGRRRSGPPVAWSTPITITTGGTYTGAWESLDPDVPAVTVSTTAAVIIQNSYIRSKGPCISSGVNGINLTVRNCRGLGLNPGVVGRAPGRFVEIEQFTKIHILNNYFESTAGIHLLDHAGNSSETDAVKILRNVAKNIDGRHSNGAGFATGVNDWSFAQFTQCDKVVSGGVEVAWNEITNVPDESRPEDVINMYKSSGFSTAKILIHDNLVNGSYPVNPGANSDFTGGGIITDGNDTAPGSAPQWVEIYDNTVLSSANYGVAIASGSNNYAHDNRIVSAGQLPNGTSLPNVNSVGTYVRNYHAIAAWANNNSDDNIIGWYRHVSSNRNDTWFPDCMVGGCASNTALKPGQAITLADVADEVTAWRNRVNTAGIAIGPTTPPLDNTGVGGATLAVHASSPARVTGSTAAGTVAVTTGTFNPPAALLVATVQMDANPGAVTGAMTNNGSALTWTTVGERSSGDSGGARGYAGIFTAPLASARTGMTVTFTGTSVPGNPAQLACPSIKLYVVTGAHTSPIGGSAEGSNTATNNLTTTAFTNAAASSLGFVSGEEWNSLGSPSSSDTTADVFDNSNISGISGYKTLGAAGGSSTFNIDAGGSGAPEWNWVAVEIKGA